MRFALRSFAFLAGILFVAFAVAEAANTPPRPPVRPAPRPNQTNLQQQQQRAMQAQQRAQRAYQQNMYRSYLAAANRARTMNPYANPYGMYGAPGANPAVTNFTDYQIQPSEEVTVRLARLPQVDELGKKKTYTTEELKELKGPDDKLTGYNAVFEDLKVGQTIRVSMARKRTDPKDPEKETWVPVGQVTGKVVKLDENSLKQFTLRVRTAPQYAAAPAGGNALVPGGAPGAKAAPKEATPKEVPVDPNKLATMIVIVSEEVVPQMAAKN